MVPIEQFAVVAELYPERCAVVDRDTRVTFRELATMSRQVARYLTRYRIADQPCAVAVYSPNDYRVLAAMLGILRAGAIIVPLHPENAPTVTRAFLARVEPCCAFYHSSLSTSVKQFSADLPRSIDWICLDGAGEGTETFAGILNGEDAASDDWLDPVGNIHRPMYYWATSGSTGTPKVVVETCGAFSLMLNTMRAYSGSSTNGRRSLVFAPMSHAAGAHSLSVLCAGGGIVVMRTFDAREVFRLIEQHQITDMLLPPTALYLLLECRDGRCYDRSSLVNVRLAVAAVAAEKLRQAVELFGPCVSQTYGQIETGMVTILDAATVAAAAAGDGAHRLKSSGRTIFVNRFAIMAEDGSLLPPMAQGEIVVRGAGVKDYLDPEMTAHARRYGWHHTGDIGYFDAEGFLYIVGRLKDVINVGGFKVTAAEVEDTIMEIPEVLECAVVAAPDPIRGEVARAVVVSRSGQVLSSSTVLRHCRRRLGQAKSPTAVEQWATLPRSPAGKIDKLRIRGHFWPASPE
jgi:acyl-CoA synthetase (AMP-forming)/AMP-acid ligase II